MFEKCCTAEVSSGVDASTECLIEKAEKVNAVLADTYSILEPIAGRAHEDAKGCDPLDRLDALYWLLCNVYQQAVEIRTLAKRIEVRIG